MEANGNNGQALRLVNARIIIALIIVGAVSLTAVIGYNERLLLTGRSPFWNVFEVRGVAIVLRIAIIIAAIAAIYYCMVAIDALEERGASQNDIEAGHLNLDASIFGLIVAILAIAAVLRSTLSEEEFIETATAT